MTETIGVSNKKAGVLEKITNKLARLYKQYDDRVLVIGANYIAGAATAGTGRLIGGNYEFVVPAVLPAMDLLIGTFNKKSILPYLAYGAGVATVHVDKIIPAISQYLS